MSAPESDLDRFFELSLDLMVIVAMGYGRFLRVSRSFVRTFGHSEEELRTRPFLDFVHPDDLAATAAAYHELLRGSAVIGFSNRYRTADGGYRWLEWLALP